MTFQTVLIGKKGENLAVEYLQKHNFFVVERNFRTKNGEIDIIASKNSIYYFIEVKTRIGEEKGKPYEAVNNRKILRLKHISEVYVLKNKLKNYKLSMMVISIVLKTDSSLESLHSYVIEE